MKNFEKYKQFQTAWSNLEKTHNVSNSEQSLRQTSLRVVSTAYANFQVSLYLTFFFYFKLFNELTSYE